MFSLLIAYTSFYWLCYGVAVVSLATWFWKTFPTYGPFVVIPAFLAWTAKTVVGYIAFKKQRAYLEHAMTMQQSKIEDDFDNNTEDKTNYVN